MITITYHPRRSTLEIEKDGKKLKKTIETNDLINHVMPGLSTMAQYPLLPRGTRFVKETECSTIIGIEFDGKQRDFHHRLDYGHGRVTVPKVGCPPGLFVCILNKEMRMLNGYLFALKAGGFTPSSPLYEFPFPNLYEDGKICWGSTLEEMSINRLPSLAAVEGMLSVFFSTTFNEELYQVHFSSTFPKYHDAGDQARSKPFRLLSGKDFKDEWIYPSYIYADITSFLRSYKEN